MSRIEEMIRELCPNGVEYKALGVVATIKNGKDYKHLTKGDIPVYGSGGIMTYVNCSVYDKPTVLIPRKGSLGNLFSHLYTLMYQHQNLCLDTYTKIYN